MQMQNIQNQSYASSRTKTFDLVLTAILATLVLVSTLFINIKLPIGQGGLIHLGTSMLFITAILFGPKKGALAGAIGMGLFDVLGGWLIWAPITIVARALQGFIVGKIAWSNGTSRQQHWIEHFSGSCVYACDDGGLLCRPRIHVQ